MNDTDSEGNVHCATTSAVTDSTFLNTFLFCDFKNKSRSELEQDRGRKSCVTQPVKRYWRMFTQG